MHLWELQLGEMQACWTSTSARKRALGACPFVDVMSAFRWISTVLSVLEVSKQGNLQGECLLLLLQDSVPVPGLACPPLLCSRMARLQRRRPRTDAPDANRRI